MFGTSGFILEVLGLDSLVRLNFYSRLFYIRRGEEIFFVNKPQGGGIKKKEAISGLLLFLHLYPSIIWQNISICYFLWI